MDRIYIGIDDTDNKFSRGTGFLSRKMSTEIQNNKLGTVEGVTRHQLFFDPRIPYTSQNSSACIDLISDSQEELINFCREFLIKESADGSDVGLAVSLENKIKEEVQMWGVRAKKEILTQNEAKSIAKKENILLEGLTGTKDGIIGSLAAIGLRKTGDDGRFIWLKGGELREIKGIMSIKDLKNHINIDAVIDKNNNFVPETEKLILGEWLRPVLIKNKIIIIAERFKNKDDYEWKVATKDYIKSISD